MASPQKLRLLPGLFGGGLPLVLQLLSSALLLVRLGGTQGLARLLSMAGRSSALVVLIAAASTGFLAIVLFFLAAGRNVPRLVPVVLATVPWLAGAAGALQGARNVLEAVASVSLDDQLLLLMAGTGELLSARLLGAWFSTTLLLATAGALFIAGMRRADAEPTAVSGDRKLEAVAALLLALVCALALLESKTLSDVLVASGNITVADRGTLLAAGASQLRAPLMLRAGALAGLVLMVLVLGGRALMRRPRDLAGALSLLPSLLVVASVLWADGRPLARMSEAMDRISQPPVELSRLRLLPFGGDGDVSRVAVVATAQGLSHPGGAEVPWGSGDKALTDLLREAVGSVAQQEPNPNGGPPSIELAVDAKVPMSELRRLIDLTTQLELTSLSLVGTSTPESELPPETPASAPDAHPLLRQLASALRSTPGTAEVSLLPVFHESSFAPSEVWVGELGAEHRLSLSKLPVDTKVTRTLELTGPERVPDELMPSRAVLFLSVTDQASLEDVAHAVRRGRAQGFQVLLSARPPPSTPQP